MTTVYDVPATPLIAQVAGQLKKEKAVSAPEWAAFVKAGIHREKPPHDPEWWHTRVAAVLRKVYLMGPIGSERLSALYGGRRDAGVKRYHAQKGSGSIARNALQQLEEAGLVVNIKGRGRAVSPTGRKLLDNAAHAVKQELTKEIPALAKY
jgi:small subunit ribosomal protein S19e